MNRKLKYLLIMGGVVLLIVVIVFFVFLKKTSTDDEVSLPEEYIGVPEGGFEMEDPNDPFLGFELVLQNLLPGFSEFDYDTMESFSYPGFPLTTESPSVTTPSSDLTAPITTESPREPVEEKLVIHSPLSMEIFYLEETASIRWGGGPKDEKLIITIKDSPLSCGDDMLCASLVNSMAPEIPVALSVPNTGAFAWKTGSNFVDEEIYPDVYVLRIRSETGRLLGESRSFLIKDRRFDNLEITLLRPAQAMSDADIAEIREVSQPLIIQEFFDDVFDEEEDSLNDNDGLEETVSSGELQALGLSEQEIRGFSKSDWIDFFTTKMKGVDMFFWPRISDSSNNPGESGEGTILWTMASSVVFVDINIWPCPIGKRIDECERKEGEKITLFEKHREFMSAVYWDGKTDIDGEIIPPGRYAMAISSHFDSDVRSGLALINIK